MQRIGLLIICIATLMFQSCNTENKPLNFSSKTLDTTYDANITVVLENAKGNSELSNSINKIIASTIVTSINDTPSNTSLTTALNSFNSEFLNFNKTYPEANTAVWELYIESEKIYQSSNVITLSINTYMFKGGAHGNDKIELLNLNAETGERLQPKDFIKNLQDFKGLAETYFKSKVVKNQNEFSMEDYFYGDEFKLPENIGFGEDGFILLYNTYEIASYDKGFTEFIIPYNKLSDYLLFY